MVSTTWHKEPSQEEIDEFLTRNKAESYVKGAHTDGEIYNYLVASGINHDNYHIESTMPGDNLKKIGQGAERDVFYNESNSDRPVQKYARIPSKSISVDYTGVAIEQSHLDILIRSINRVMSLRIIARMINSYNNWYASKNPDKITEIPYIVVPKSLVDSNAVINEPMLPDEKNPLRPNEYTPSLLKFLPRIKKDYFFFDQRGVGNIYRAGTVSSQDPLFNGRPRYHIIDGAYISPGRFKDDSHFSSMYEKIKSEELQYAYRQIDAIKKQIEAT